MGLKVTSASLHWAQPSAPHSPSSSLTLASAISPPSSKSRIFLRSDGGALFCRYVHKSALFLGTHQHSKLYWSRSCGNGKSRIHIIRRALTAGLDSFSDEEFSKKIQELALRFQLSEDDDDDDDDDGDGSVRMDDNSVSDSDAKFLENVKPFDSLAPPDFPERTEIIPANIERIANSVDIPFSLRMMKRKKHWQEVFEEAGDLACCSVKKAFSSMVLIIRELHCYTLQMRESLCYEDLQEILASVQKEMHASFVWLFQKVFSHTPTLMMYLMILLANYSVYSMSTNAVIAAMSPVQEYRFANMELVSLAEDHNPSEQKFESSTVRTLKLSSSNGKTDLVGGNNGGGGGKYGTICSGTDGEGRFDEPNYEVSSISPTRTNVEESVSRPPPVSIEEEETLCNLIVGEASRIQGASRDECFNQETIQRFVSPVGVKIETDQHPEYLKTELLYQMELAQEPKNPLLLANYAQFLYLVAHDFDRAEDYFKRATNVEPKDAEALNKYANFLWVVRKDVWAAEETFLEAISAEPDNSYYAGNYAHFLWSTGGEDTCFPLSSPDSSVDV